MPNGMRNTRKLEGLSSLRPNLADLTQTWHLESKGIGSILVT